MTDSEREEIRERYQYLLAIALPRLTKKTQLFPLIKHLSGGGTGFDLERDPRTNTKEKLIHYTCWTYKHSEICWWLSQNTPTNLAEIYYNSNTSITGQNLNLVEPETFDEVMKNSPSPFPAEICDLSRGDAVAVPAKKDHGFVENLLKGTWELKPEPQEEILKTPAPAQPAGLGGAFEAMIMDIVSKSSVNQETLAATVKAEIAKQKPRIKTIVVSPSKTKREVKGRTHKMFRDCLELAEERIPVYLTGPAGCGKTFLAEQVSESMGLEYSETSCNGGMYAEDFFGRLLPTGDAGKFEFHSTPMLDAVENGGLHCFDELDATPADIRFALQSLFAKRECFLPARIGGHHLKAHENFVVIATGNSFGNGGSGSYQREVADAAAHDRFRAGTIPMDYDRDLEAELIRDDILHWGRDIRSQIVSKNLERVLSTRVMIDYGRMADRYSDRWDMDKIEKSYFVDWTSDELRQIGRK